MRGAGSSKSRFKATLEHHVDELLPASIEAAKQLGVRTMVCFSFSRTGLDENASLPDEGIQILPARCRESRGGGHHYRHGGGPLGLREHQHPGCGHRAARRSSLVRHQLGSRQRLRRGRGPAIPDGYANVRPYVRHVHFKDSKVDPATGQRPWTLEGGVIDWAGQIAALVKDGYQGYVSVEHHVRPQVKASIYTLERIRRHIREAGGQV